MIHHETVSATLAEEEGPGNFDVIEFTAGEFSVYEQDRPCGVYSTLEAAMEEAQRLADQFDADERERTKEPDPVQTVVVVIQLRDKTLAGARETVALAWEAAAGVTSRYGEMELALCDTPYNPDELAASLACGVDCIGQVVENWSSGDLAGAVNMADGFADDTRAEFPLLPYTEGGDEDEDADGQDDDGPDEGDVAAVVAAHDQRNGEG